jgi:hypothetical protein
VDRITVAVAGGTLTFTGPAELLERPADDEISRRIAESSRSTFDRHHAESQRKLGLIETRVQLEYLCTGGNLHTFCRDRGIQVTAHPRPRGLRLR